MFYPYILVAVLLVLAFFKLRAASKRLGHAVPAARSKATTSKSSSRAKNSIVYGH